MKKITVSVLQLETVALAQLAKDIQKELECRAEYAIRFGIPAPTNGAVNVNKRETFRVRDGVSTV